LDKNEIEAITHRASDKRDEQGRRRAAVEVIREASVSTVHSGHGHLLALIKAQLSLVLSKSVVQSHCKGSPSAKKK
jgi:hypothetical protein